MAATGTRRTCLDPVARRSHVVRVPRVFVVSGVGAPSSLASVAPFLPRLPVPLVFRGHHRAVCAQVVVLGRQGFALQLRRAFAGKQASGSPPT